MKFTISQMFRKSIIYFKALIFTAHHWKSILLKKRIIWAISNANKFTDKILPNKQITITAYGAKKFIQSRVSSDTLLETAVLMGIRSRRIIIMQRRIWVRLIFLIPNSWAGRSINLLYICAPVHSVQSAIHSNRL